MSSTWDIDWDDPVQVAVLRTQIEAQMRAERGESSWAGNERYADASWDAACFQLGVL